MEEFLVDFTNIIEEEWSKNQGLGIDCATMNLLTKSMDTEYDRNVVRTIIALCHTRLELYELEIDPSTAKKHIKNVVEIANQCKDALIAGENLVYHQLQQKHENLKKKNSWMR